MKCLLCDKESISLERLKITLESRTAYKKRFPGMNPDEYMAQNGVCSDCLTLPLDERRKLADTVINETLDEVRRYVLEDALKRRGNSN